MESTDTLKRSAEDTLESIEKNKPKIDEIKEPSGANAMGTMRITILIGFIDENGEVDYVFHPYGDVNETTEIFLEGLYTKVGEPLAFVTDAFFDVLSCQLTPEEQKNFDIKDKHWIKYCKTLEHFVDMTYEDLKEINSDKRWIAFNSFEDAAATLKNGKLAVRSYIVNHVH